MKIKPNEKIYLEFVCKCGTHFVEDVLYSERFNYACPKCGRKQKFTKAKNIDIVWKVCKSARVDKVKVEKEKFLFFGREVMA